MSAKKHSAVNFPGGPVAPNAGDQGSIPGQGTMILHAATKSSHASTKGPTCLNEDGRTHVLPLETRCNQVNK